MSIGLATRKIAEYTAAIGTLSEQINQAEAELIKATANKNDDAVRDIQNKLTMYKTLFGLVKDFLEFWKDVIKTTLGILKMFNELASGR